MYATIKEKYYWLNLYKDLVEYTEHCIPCKERNLKRQRAELQDTGVPPFPWAKVAVDVSGPYPTSLSGNRYIVGFIDIYSGYPEAFAVKNKSAANISHLLIEEIFPQYGCPLILISDNDTKNIAKEVQDTLAYLNIMHIKSAFYHPESNAKIERFHRTLHNILSKRVNDNPTTWDAYLNQALAAIRFTVSETAKFSPYFLVYNRDVVLPVDNILRPRRKYLG
jgi:transposase InsO family protein